MPNILKKGLGREGKNRKNGEYLSKSNFSPNFGYEHQLFYLLVIEDLAAGEGGLIVLSLWLFCGCWFVWQWFISFLTTKATSCFKGRYWKTFGVSFSQIDLLMLENQCAGARWRSSYPAHTQNSQGGRNCFKRGSAFNFQLIQLLEYFFQATS